MRGKKPLRTTYPSGCQERHTDMVTREDIEKITRVQSSGSPVLSVYLNLDPKRGERSAAALAARGLLDRAQSHLPSQWALKAFARERERVQSFVASYRPEGRALIIFSSSPAGLWRVIPLQVPVINFVHYAEAACVKPLVDLLDEHERYAVILVDEEKARLFSIHMGLIEESTELIDQLPPKHKQQGLLIKYYSKHRDTHVLWHAKNVVTMLTSLVRRKTFDRLIIAGQDGMVSELRQYLTPSLSTKVAGFSRLDKHATTADILRETLAIAERVEREKEKGIVGEILTRARKTERGALGLAATVESVLSGRVLKLVVADGFAAETHRCASCAQPCVGPEATCSACGGKPSEATDDAVEWTIHEAFLRGASVEVVRGEAARALLREGGIGAILRY